MARSKQRQEEEGEGGGGAYEIDWAQQERRPFKRGFLPYGSEAAEGEAAKRRKALGLELIEDPAGDDATPLPASTFEGLGVLPEWLLDALREEMRYEPTPLQAQVLPIALAGQNVVAQAPPGRGQAGAYLVCSAVHVEDQAPLTEEDAGPVVLVLVPTQEAANAVAEEAGALFGYSARSRRHAPGGLRCVSVSGGGARSEKLRELTAAGCHVMVGTPKRVHDMASKEQISLLRVTSLVLDGADKLLELGFEEEVRSLAAWLRPERQTAIFSGTWPRSLHELSRELCFSGGDPVRFSAKGTAAAAKAKAKAKAPMTPMAPRAKSRAKEADVEEWGDPDEEELPADS